MDMYTATCRDYDPIIGEYEYLKRRGLCTEKAVWRLIGRIVELYGTDRGALCERSALHSLLR